MKKRKEVEEYIISWIGKITNSKNNMSLYINMFKDMNDKEFDLFMNKLATKENVLQVILPINKSGDDNVTIENNLALGKQLGNEFFQRLIYTKDSDLPETMTTTKFLILDLPFRRAKQTVEKGIGVASDSKHIDTGTGQVKGVSAGAKITFPEIQLLNGMGMKNTLKEILRDRGGDNGASKVLQDSLTKTGRATQDLTDMYSDGVVSTKTLKAYLLGMHIKSTLTD